MKIVNLGIGDDENPITGIGTTSLIQVERSFVGSTPATHSNTATVQVYRGSYNIVGKKYFTESPKGNPQAEKSRNNLEFQHHHLLDVVLKKWLWYEPSIWWYNRSIYWTW